MTIPATMVTAAVPNMALRMHMSARMDRTIASSSAFSRAASVGTGHAGHVGRERKMTARRTTRRTTRLLTFLLLTACGTEEDPGTAASSDGGAATVDGSST